LTGYREYDFEKYLYISRDFGRKWESIMGNLPSESVNVVAELMEEAFLFWMWKIFKASIKQESLGGRFPC